MPRQLLNIHYFVVNLRGESGGYKGEGAQSGEVFALDLPTMRNARSGGDTSCVHDGRPKSRSGPCRPDPLSPSLLARYVLRDWPARGGLSVIDIRGADTAMRSGQASTPRPQTACPREALERGREGSRDVGLDVGGATEIKKTGTARPSIRGGANDELRYQRGPQGR